MQQRFERGEWPLFVRRLVTGVFQENTWLIADRETGEAALIDPGEGVLDHFDDEALPDGTRLTKIFLTHAHLDHVWGLSDAHERWPDAPIVMHADDLELLRALPRQGAMIGFPLSLPAPPEPTHFVGEGDVVTLGNRSASVMHTPGHTEGGICYIFDTGDVFVGDMIIQGAVGRTDLPGGNPRKMQASLLRLCELNPDYWIHGGHGPQKPMSEELRTNYILAPMSKGITPSGSIRGVGM